jgi:phospholipid N-methyltransferase
MRDGILTRAVNEFNIVAKHWKGTLDFDAVNKVPVVFIAFNIRHVPFHVRLKLLAISRELLPYESLVVHANLTKLRKTFLEAQVLERAILEDSGREELPSCLYLLHSSRLYIIVVLVGLWRAESTLYRRSL